MLLINSSPSVPISSKYQIYDFLQPTGSLIVATSSGNVHYIPYYENSSGETSIPLKGGNAHKYYACMVFINETTVFLAGGQGENKKYQHTMTALSAEKVSISQTQCKFALLVLAQFSLSGLHFTPLLFIMSIIPF